MRSLQMDVDDEIFNLVDLHMGMLGGEWKWQDLQSLLWLDHHKIHEVVKEKDSEIYRGKKERVKFIALKAMKESSNQEKKDVIRHRDEKNRKCNWNALDAVIEIISLVIVQNYLGKKIKRPLLEVLEVIVKMTPKTKLTMKLVSWINRQMRSTANGAGLRVADSHTGNHPEDDFMPLETIRRLCSVFGRRSHLGFEGETSEPKGRVRHQYTWTRFLKTKNEAFEKFEILSRKIQNQLGSSIIAIRTDYGWEFDNEVQFAAYCDAQGITHNISAPHTPQSNGVVERKNRTLQEMSRTMLNEQSIPQKF
ncbi:retrovirus-related pol polyprotein from transposon TNT 1-94 [Tanacetum coccineum]